MIFNRRERFWMQDECVTNLRVLSVRTGIRSDLGESQLASWTGSRKYALVIISSGSLTTLAICWGRRFARFVTVGLHIQGESFSILLLVWLSVLTQLPLL